MTSKPIKPASIATKRESISEGMLILKNCADLEVLKGCGFSRAAKPLKT
jgi:hypothetical protein